MMKFVLLLTLVYFIIKTVYELIQHFADKRYSEKRRKEWQPFYEKRHQEWYGICENCGTKGGLHRFHGKKYCANCHARIKTQYDLSKKSQGEEMELNKILDEAIRLHETAINSGLNAGYVVNSKTYPNYISNSSWEEFCDDMKVNHPAAYDNYKNGDGKELDERKVGQNIYPPKMASFGSSSRFIYNLMKHDKSFKFEEQLPTTVGGTANLDGFKETSDSYVFVEAKCREPYSKKNKFYGQKYFELYDFISKSDNTLVTIDTDLAKGKEHEMEVVFKYNGKAMECFDLKQMISHLLGIGTAILKKEMYTDKPIKFIYLIYNPEPLVFKNEKTKNEICNIYYQTCNEAEAAISKELFKDVLLYLKEKYYQDSVVNIERIANNFSFSICNQENFIEKLNANN